MARASWIRSKGPRGAARRTHEFGRDEKRSWQQYAAPDCGGLGLMVQWSDHVGFPDPQAARADFQKVPLDLRNYHSLPSISPMKLRVLLLACLFIPGGFLLHAEQSAPADLESS